MILSPLAQGEYSIDRLWTPGLKARKNLRRLGKASVGSELEVDELNLLQYINQSRAQRIPAYDKANYRAERAVEKRRGNCLAVAELWLGQLSCTPHTSLFLWTGGHAMAAVKGRKNWWLADDTGYWRAGADQKNYISRQLDVSEHTELFDAITEEAGGNAYVERFALGETPTETPQWQAIEGSIGDTSTPYARTTTILTPSEAVRFISAYGDITRLVMNRADLWQQYGDQVKQNLPINIAAAQLRAAEIALAAQQEDAQELVGVG